MLQPGDSIRNSAKAKASIKKELYGLFAQDVFRKIKKADIPSDSIILPSKMVQVIKNVGTMEEKDKDRIIIGRHRYREKPVLIHTSFNIRHGNIRLQVSIAADEVDDV